MQVAYCIIIHLERIYGDQQTWFHIYRLNGTYLDDSGIIERADNKHELLALFHLTGIFKSIRTILESR